MLLFRILFHKSNENKKTIKIFLILFVVSPFSFPMTLLQTENAVTLQGKKGKE